jgi:hypothetical protein
MRLKSDLKIRRMQWLRLRRAKLSGGCRLSESAAKAASQRAHFIDKIN